MDGVRRSVRGPGLNIARTSLLSLCCDETDDRRTLSVSLCWEVIEDPRVRSTRKSGGGTLDAPENKSRFLSSLGDLVGEIVGDLSTCCPDGLSHVVERDAGATAGN